MNLITQLSAEAPSRRPGPFGPAWALLPKNQELLTIAEDVKVWDALEQMADKKYSQLPVRDDKRNVVGVFSWKSYGNYVVSSSLKANESDVSLANIAVREAMEEATFIHHEAYIDTETDWGDLDHVLVGNRTDLHGVLTIADVFGRLNDFAEAFVLVYEIEHDIRDLIVEVVGDERIPEVLGRLSEKIERTDWNPQSLEELTFFQYTLVFCSGLTWDLFEPVFQMKKVTINEKFGVINKIRNDLMHFRRAMTPKDTDILRRFREGIRDYRSWNWDQKKNSPSVRPR